MGWCEKVWDSVRSGEKAGGRSRLLSQNMSCQVTVSDALHGCSHAAAAALTRSSLRSSQKLLHSLSAPLKTSLRCPILSNPRFAPLCDPLRTNGQPDALRRCAFLSPTQTHLQFEEVFVLLRRRALLVCLQVRHLSRPCISAQTTHACCGAPFSHRSRMCIVL